MQIEQTRFNDPINSGKGIANYIQESAPSQGVSVSGFEHCAGEYTAAVGQGAGNINMTDATYLRPGAKEETVSDQLLEETMGSALDRTNELAIVSNTTSAEDLKAMEKDGFSALDTDARTIVTVTDKIKATLARAGVDISCYGDTLSKEELEQITGSSAVATELAAQIAQQFAAADLPPTEENLQDAVQAYEQAATLGGLSDQALSYLIGNHLTPTIAHIYKAEYSYAEGTGAVASVTAGAPKAQMLTDADFAQLRDQIAHVIEEAGVVVDEASLADSRWLIEQQLPLTTGNLVYLQQLKSFSGIEGHKEQLFDAMTDAVLEGGRPQDAMLLAGFSLMDQAREAFAVVQNATEDDLAYVVEHEQPLTVEALRENKLRDAVVGETRRGAGRVTEQTDGAEAVHGHDEESETGVWNKAEPVDEAELTENSPKALALLTARRQLEEARLAMTVEANYALLKRGISIDTRPLAELVDALKAQENQYYQTLLRQSGIDDGAENVSIFRETTETIADLKTYPAYVLTADRSVDTLRSLHEAGRPLKDTLTRANESYEALMTKPRADMGDSMHKAFANVDDILQDLSLDTTEANRRAVRILAYNRTELTPENIALVKEKDEEVQRAFASMTPKVTLEMIRRGVNPLDMELPELNRVAREIQSDIGDENERFSKYLWKLEQNKEISEEERSAYIGIYRLIAQVEKTDGAAIGALMAQGADVTMRSLLTAVRSGRKESMDYRVDDAFAGVDAVHKSERIDEQIEGVYQTNCVRDVLANLTPDALMEIGEQTWGEMTPEQMKEALSQYAATHEQMQEDADLAYAKETLSQMQEALESSEAVYRQLERLDLPNTVNNVLAMQQILSNPSRMFAKLWNAEGSVADRMDRVEDMKELVLERFGEAVKTPQELADAQETLAEIAENAMKGMITEEDVTSIDLRELRRMSAQFSLCAKQARKEENFVIPVQTGEGVTGVSLKIVRGKEQKGLVDILFRGSSMGKIAASFEAKEQGISGVIAADNEETRRILADHLGMLAERLNESGQEPVDLQAALVPELSLEKMSEHTEQRRKAMQAEEPESAQYEVQTTRLYHIAESFLLAIQEFL